MNIQQLEYIVAVDKFRHFVNAAESCGVTQPTLSSMIQKLEAELDVSIFDRNSHPVKPTPLGEKIIRQAKTILFNSQGLRELVSTEKKSIEGELHLGVIPTVAPYILPMFIKEMRRLHPKIHLHVSEMRTDAIIQKLKNAEIDIALLATPLSQHALLEIPIYYEGFCAYISPSDPLFSQPEIISKKMPYEHLWILQEGHCLRNQIFNFCNAKKSSFISMYEAGSIDTLIKIVDANGGYTIIPELHLPFLSEEQRKNIRPLVSPAVLREISLVVREDYVKEQMLNVCANLIKHTIPEKMIDARLKKFAIRL